MVMNGVVEVGVGGRLCRCFFCLLSLLWSFLSLVL